MVKTDPKHYRKFGKHVAQLRERAGLTQEQLAEETGISYPTIRGIEQGRQFTSLGGLHRLAKVLKVHPSDLLTNQ
jgi:transcriptional regulator with XRE-family HTH domain